MKKLPLIPIGIGISLVWLFFFLLIFQSFQVANRELSWMSANKAKLENINFYKRNLETLQINLQELENQAFGSRSSAEFMARLPKMAETAGIRKLSMETVGVKKDDDREVTELKITVVSLFPQAALFIDMIERTKLPLRVISLNMNYDKGALTTVTVLEITKKRLEE